MFLYSGCGVLWDFGVILGCKAPRYLSRGSGHCYTLNRGSCIVLAVWDFCKKDAVSIFG